MDVVSRLGALLAQADFPPEEAALLIAAEEYPGLDPQAYLDRLDAMAGEVGPRLADELDPERLVGILNAYLFEDLGFRGNIREYYDPRNSYLNEVLDRRLGLPITLAMVYIAVGRRLGLPVAGVSFPGHFLVTYRATPQPLFLDPFNHGRVLRATDFRLLAIQRHGLVTVEPHDLAPAAPHAIVARLLRNLRRIYTARQDLARAVRCAERLLLAEDAPEERRDLGLLLSAAGRPHEAIPHLERYLAGVPDAQDREEVAELLRRLRAAVHGLN